MTVASRSKNWQIPERALHYSDLEIVAGAGPTAKYDEPIDAWLGRKE